MREAVQAYCEETEQEIPTTAGQLANVIYRSLAHCYGKTVDELERMTGKTYPCIHIVGGGANAAYLNALTAKVSGKKVLAGPIEATAIGNLLAQMISHGEVVDLPTGRQCIHESFAIETYLAN